jgi:mono/diheme cytochrome c family protein
MRAVTRIALVLALAAGAVRAQDFPAGHFSEQTGEAIYRGICQGCHMPDAHGAVGAGAYPALAGDPRLASSLYPALVVVRGQKAMPSFGPALSDEQIAAAVNYVRTHFGNHYTDAVTAAQVQTLRAAR